MDAHSAGQLSQSADGEFHFLAGGHDEVGKFVDNEDYIRQEAVPVFGIKVAVDEFVVVFGYLAHTSLTEQLVALVHLDAEAVEGTHNLTHVGDDGLLAVGQLSQIVALYLVVE